MAKFAARILAVLALLSIHGLPPARAQEQAREEEVVANLATGRVIVHVASEAILFATIEQPGDAGSIPPRVVSLGPTHIGVLLGAAEWLLPSEGPTPIRLDRRIKPIHIAQQGGPDYAGEAEPDLEMIGEVYLQALRPFAAQLHHKIDLGADEPLFELVIIGYGPKYYGPEVWVVEYRAVQEEVQDGYMQTRIMRPRMTQIYPPEKHQPHTLMELSYPSTPKTATLLEQIQGNDLTVLRIARSDERFLKVVDKINAGKANTADAAAAGDFLRAVAVPLANKGRFAVGTYVQDRGVQWLVPPMEPLEKATEEDKPRPPDAPSLVHKP